MVGSRDNPNKAMLQLPAEVAGSPPLVVATESPLQGEKYCKGCSTDHWRQSWSYLHHMQGQSFTSFPLCAKCSLNLVAPPPLFSSLQYLHLKPPLIFWPCSHTRSGIVLSSRSRGEIRSVSPVFRRNRTEIRPDYGSLPTAHPGNGIRYTPPGFRRLSAEISVRGGENRRRRRRGPERRPWWGKKRLGRP